MAPTQIAKVGVEGSNPFARSRFYKENNHLRMGPGGCPVPVSLLDTTGTPPK